MSGSLSSPYGFTSSLYVLFGSLKSYNILCRCFKKVAFSIAKKPALGIISLFQTNSSPLCNI